MILPVGQEDDGLVLSLLDIEPLRRGPDRLPDGGAGYRNQIGIDHVEKDLGRPVIKRQRTLYEADS